MEPSDLYLDALCAKTEEMLFESEPEETLRDPDADDPGTLLEGTGSPVPPDATP